MINRSTTYTDAITGDSRRMDVQVVIDIIDPDIIYGGGGSNDPAEWTNYEQLYNKALNPCQNYGTLEANRWILDGTLTIEPDGEVGFLSDQVCDIDGYFETEPYAEIYFSGVEILQSCSVVFADYEYDGLPEEFTIEIFHDSSVIHSVEYTGNTRNEINVSKFTVYDPDRIRVTIHKMSDKFRRARIIEILAGTYEIWDGHKLSKFDVGLKGDPTNAKLPYGTCKLTIENADRRFEPRSKDGLFQSIAERQGIDVFLAPRINGTPVYTKVGRFFQYDNGWTTGNNGLTMDWNLVDIVGLMANRIYIHKGTLPTTLSGWVHALMAQLGDTFADFYTIDSDYTNLPVTVDSADHVNEKKVGDLLRFLAMKTDTWCRADARTGKLAFEPRWNEGDKITLDNLTGYPTIGANSELASVTLTIYDGSEELPKITVGGNSSSATENITIDNPFIHDETAALLAARRILEGYGGNTITLKGRGNPASEIGDVDTVWIDESQAVTARRTSATLSMSSGVLKDCQSTLIQADGGFIYSDREIITEDCIWTSPAGVSELKVFVVGGGAGGTSGTSGTWEANGEDGEDGAGAKVWYGTVNCNDQETFDVHIGSGGGRGQNGTNSTFGDYDSDFGSLFQYGYTDLQAGESYARTGVKSPLPNSGNGGAKGLGGTKGEKHTESRTDSEGQTHTREVIDSYPTPGTPGALGASGCVVIYYDKEGLNE